MELMEDAYDEMKWWRTYIEGHNEEMIDTIGVDKAIMRELQKKVEHHMEEYLKLVMLSNDLIDKIPRSLKADEDMMDIFKPKKEIYDFLKLWSQMVEEFRARIKERC